MDMPTCSSQPLVTAPLLPSTVITYLGSFMSLKSCKMWSVVTGVFSIILPVALCFVIFLLSTFVFTSFIFVSASSLNFYSSRQEMSMSQRSVLNHNKEKLVAVHCTLSLCNELVG